MNQLNHYNTINKETRFPIHLVCDEIRTPQNIGMSLRVAEAMGCKSFYIHEHSPNLDNRIVQRTARNTAQNLNVQTYSDGVSLLEQFKTDGFQIVALEITDKSIEISRLELQANKPLVLVIGSERFGIQKEMLDLCESAVHINMFGKNSSMNVVTSLGIALYEITKKLNN